MNLKIIEKSNKKKNRYCGIHFSKNGNITIYEDAVKQIGLKEGDHIAIMQDNDKKDDFYLIKIDNKELPRLRKKSSDARLLVSGYSDAYRAIIDHFQLPLSSIKILLGGAVKTPFGTAWVLITGPLKKSALKEVPYA